MSGFRATIAVEDPTGCPVASASRQVDGPIDSQTRSRTADETVVEDVSVPAGTAVELDDETELTPLQSGDRSDIYRLERANGADCVCTLVEQTGTPVTSVQAVDGSLFVTVRPLELEDITTVVSTLRDRFDGVVVEELLRHDESSPADPVIVDRNQLTDRQREIVETAHELGYFDYPKGANATDVAEALGIARSTFTEHLAAAQRKLLDSIVTK